MTRFILMTLAAATLAGGPRLQEDGAVVLETKP
jgi:hypothetical protein